MKHFIIAIIVLSASTAFAGSSITVGDITFHRLDDGSRVTSMDMDGITFHSTDSTKTDVTSIEVDDDLTFRRSESGSAYTLDLGDGLEINSGDTDILMPAIFGD